MTHADVSMFKTVRPPMGFEALYQGLSGSLPIAFPGTLDSLAGTDGYSADLLSGIPVQLGARVFVQIPIIIDMYTPSSAYAYQVLWRTRNQRGFNQQILNGRVPSGFHLPGDELGRRERQASGAAADLFFLPGASDVEIFEQAEPVGDGAATLTIRQQIYVPTMAQPWTQPILPTGSAGVWQQGAYQYTSNVNCSGPTFFPIWLDACGDEMMILMYKTVSGDTWDFSGADQGVSNTYGNNDGGLPNNPNIGILVATGTMGSG